MGAGAAAGVADAEATVVLAAGAVPESGLAQAPTSSAAQSTPTYLY